MTDFVNGRKVAESDTWQEPVEVDVQSQILLSRGEPTDPMFPKK